MDYTGFYEKIGYRFSNEALLKQAFTHNSVAVPGGMNTYQRLEFLGDRVLSLVIAEMLYRQFPDEDEGSLAKRHTYLVREETLSKIALDRLGMKPYLIVSEAEISNNPALLADACEAVLGAIYLEAGYAKARDVITDNWQSLASSYEEPPIDAKSKLQEWAQSKALGLPVYNVLKVEGSDHSPEFTIEVSVNSVEQKGLGFGPSKKIAQQKAATDMLRKVGA